MTRVVWGIVAALAQLALGFGWTAEKTAGEVGQCTVAGDAGHQKLEMPPAMLEFGADPDLRWGDGHKKTKFILKTLAKKYLSYAPDRRLCLPSAN